MLKYLCTLAAATALSVAAYGAGTISLRGTSYRVDTTFHNQVGPGVTQTSLWLQGPSSDLRVFYCTIDRTNPYVSLAAVSATDKLAGNERISAMAQRKSKPGSRYFVGINGDFFATSGTTARGVSKVGSSTGSMVVDGEIFRTRYNPTSYRNFVVTKDNQVHINPFRYSGTITAPNGSTATLAAVNNSAPANNNKVTIFNYLYYGSTDETTGTEVAAVLPEGGHYDTTGPFRLVISGEPSTAGDMTIPDGGFVLNGQGSAQAFVAGLHNGDTLTISTTWKCGDISVDPLHVISGNPKILENGEVLDTEADRGDASASHPRSALGYSDDGNTVFFLVVDGRSTLSAGVRTSVLAEILRYAGATDGLNVDGGGSSVLYTSTLGIRNRPSDGTERADGNGFFVVSNAPDDDEVASIRFVDWTVTLPKYGMYTPKFYGYNQYGMLVDTDVQGVTLECDPLLGSTDGGTFSATGSLDGGTLTARLGDMTAEIHINTLDAEPAILMKPTLLIDNRDYPVEVTATIDQATFLYDPSQLAWAIENPNIASITNGTLRGLRNGETQLTCVLGDFRDTTTVKVEISPTPYQQIPWTDWTLKGSGAKNLTLDPDGTLAFEYSGGRAPYVLLRKELTFFGLPDSVSLTFTSSIPIDYVQTDLRNAQLTAAHYTKYGEDVGYEAATTYTVHFNLDEMGGTDNVHTYPLNLRELRFVPASTADKGAQTITLHSLSAHYNVAPPVNPADVNADGTVDVQDLNLVINAILSQGSGMSADINADGTTDVQDINIVINAILGIK